MKFVVCIKGHGQGCDYTIGCNKKFFEMEAESEDDLINKLHNNEHGRRYMCSFDLYGDNCYDKVYIVQGELKDISKILEQKIKQSLSEIENKLKLQKEQEERELYRKLKQKYESE